MGTWSPRRDTGKPHRSYGRTRLLLLALAMWACQRPTPFTCDDVAAPCPEGQHCAADRTCAEGPPPPQTCNESRQCGSAQPVCDAHIGLCRACFAGEDSLCREHSDSTPRCLSPRCVECLPPSTGSFEAPECVSRTTARPGQTPVCDAGGNKCRACQLHSECSSGVCAKDNLGDADGVPQGSCVPREHVLVVDPLQCGAAGPVFCTPKQAMERLDRDHRYMLIRRSARAEDFSDIEVGTVATQGMDLYLIGPTADTPPARVTETPRVLIGTPDHRGFIVSRKNRVTLEGFAIRDAKVGVECYGDGTDTQVRVVRSYLGNNRTAIAIHDDCQLTMTGSWVGGGPKTGAYAGIPGNGLAMDVVRADFSVSNSVISENGDPKNPAFGGVRISALGGGTQGVRLSTIVNTTFFGHLGWMMSGMSRYTTIYCDAPLAGRLVVLNSLFFQDPSVTLFDRYISPTCGAQLFHLGSDDASLTDNDSVVVPRGQDPGFRDLAARDFRLIAGPASPLQERLRNGGIGGVVIAREKISAPPVDMDGRRRPLDGQQTPDKQRVAIGAFEPAAD